MATWSYAPCLMHLVLCTLFMRSCLPSPYETGLTTGHYFFCLLSFLIFKECLYHSLMESTEVRFSSQVGTMSLKSRKISLAWICVFSWDMSTGNSGSTLPQLQQWTRPESASIHSSHLLSRPLSPPPFTASPQLYSFTLTAHLQPFPTSMLSPIFSVQNVKWKWNPGSFILFFHSHSFVYSINKE